MLEAHNGYRTSHATVKIAGSISHLCNGLCMVIIIYEEIYRKATAKKNTVFFFFFKRNRVILEMKVKEDFTKIFTLQKIK